MRKAKNSRDYTMQNIVGFLCLFVFLFASLGYIISSIYEALIKFSLIPDTRGASNGDLSIFLIKALFFLASGLLIANGFRGVFYKKLLIFPLVGIIKTSLIEAKGRFAFFLGIVYICIGLGFMIYTIRF